MKAGLPQLGPKLLERWARLGLYSKLREAGKGRPKFLLHDGPPYANGNIHIGTALNKILKDIVVRSQQMLGFEADYVPGWDCHGLPIEWKIEEQYRAKGRSKDDVPAAEFRAECRAFAAHWLDVQREEFKRLGVEGDWDHPYVTMAPRSEGRIAGELMKFAMNGLLYRGSKPVMWSVVEKTALAEAEVEYQDYQSDTVWVKFPVVDFIPTRLEPLLVIRLLGSMPLRSLRLRQSSRIQEDLNRHLDDDALDAAWQPRHLLLLQDRLWPLRGDEGARGQLGQGWRQAHPRRQARRRRDEVRESRRVPEIRRCDGG